MNTNDAVYSNTDEEYQEICEFLDRLSAKTPFVLWESGRMNYWRYNVHASKERDDRFFRENVRVWRSNAGQIVGLCISEYGHNDLFIEVLPGYEGIYAAIFHFGTHAAYRRRGFAKAVIKACFGRMRANGIHTVEIASRAEPDISNYLYDALSPQTKREVHKYAKKGS